MKRALAFFMAFAMMTSALPVTAMAATVEKVSLEVEERQVLPGEETTVGYFGFRKSIERFEIGEKVSITIGEGFTLVETPLYDGAGKPLNEEWDLANNTVSFAPVDRTPRLFDIGGFTVLADAGTTVGTDCVATVTVENFDPQRIVIATVVDEIDYSFYDELSLSVKKQQILAGGEASFDVLGVDKGLGFAIDELVTLELSEGFSFVENDEFYDGDGTVIQVEDLNADKDKLVVKAPINPGHGFDLEELTIKADAGLPLGTKAKMTASMVGYDPVTEVVATVVSEITETPDDDEENGGEPYMFLDIPILQVLEGGTVSYSQFNVSTGNRDFRLNEIVTLTISEGFEFVPAAIHDHDGTILQNVVWSADGRTVEVPVYKKYDTGFDMEAMTIRATTAQLGDEAVLTVNAANYPDVSQVIAKVVSEITMPADELELDVRKVQILAGGEAAFNVLGVDKGILFTEGDKVTLTLNNGFSFVENDKFYDGDGTPIEVFSWSANEIVVLAPEDPGHGFDLEELTIKADANLPLGTEAEMTASMDGYAPVTKIVAKVVSEITTPADKLELDVKKVQIAAGGEASFNVLGVDKGIRFREGDKVTLTLNEGFSFVENDEFYDGDGTPIEVFSWSANEIVVLAPEDPGYGFDLEELTIKADAGLAGGTEAEMTASMDGYAPVTEEVATVVSGITETPDDDEENGGEPYMFLDIPILQVLEGGTVSYNTFGVDTKYRDFKLDEIVTLTISEGFEFVPAAIHDHDGTILQNVVWSADGRTVEVPVYKKYDTGFDMEAMTIRATTAQLGDEAVLTVSADHYPDVSQVIAIVVNQIQVGSEVSVDEVVELEEDGTVTLQDVELTAVGTNFAVGETLTLTLSSGFVFVYEGEEDHNFVSIVKSADNELELTVLAATYECNISNMEIKAVTAEAGDIARLTVAGADRYADTTKVARVSVPVGGNGKAKFKVVNAREELEDFDGYIGGKDTPELQIKVTDIDNLKDGENVIELEVQLDGAEFKNADGDYLTVDEAAQLITFMNEDDEEYSAEKDKKGSWYFDLAGDDIMLKIEEDIEDTLTFTLSYEGEVIGEDDVIIVNLQSMMDKVKVGSIATVSASGDLGRREDIVFCEIIEKGLLVFVNNVKEVAVEEIVTLDDLKITANYGDLPAEIELELSKGFEFIDTRFIDGSDFTVEEADENMITISVSDDVNRIIMEEIRIEAVTAAVGDVATITARAVGMDAVKTEVAVVSDGNVRMTVDTKKGIPEIYSGVNRDSAGITEGAKHNSARVTIEEPFAGTWNTVKEFSLTLPDGVYVTDVEIIDTNMETYRGESVEEAFVEAYENGDSRSFKFGRRIFEETMAGDDPMELEFRLELVAVPGFEGDVTLTLSGAALETRKVTIARFVRPYEVSVDTLTLRHGQNGTMNDIVITEAEEGLWEEANRNHDGVYEFELHDANGNLAFLPNNSGDVTANAESEIGVEELANGVGFILEEESDEEAAVVTLSGYEVRTTGNSLGNYALLLKTPGAELLMDETLLSGVKLSTVADAMDVYDVVDEDAVTVYKRSSGSSNKNNSSETKTEEPKVTAAETTTVAGETTTVDTTEQLLESVPQAEKEACQEQLKKELPEAETVGNGAYTFAVKGDDAVSEGTGSNANAGTKDPQKVSFDLKGQNVEEPSHLTLVKYVEQPDGTVKVVKLGGAFDPVTNTFSAYADGEGVYDLVCDPGVTKITFAIGQTEVSVNGEVQTNDVAPVLYENRTMVPLRAIAEVLGVEVIWNEATKTVFMMQGDKVISLTVDGADGTAVIMNDRTMVQLRYIGENFGASVRWIPSTQSIEIVK